MGILRKYINRFQKPGRKYESPFLDLNLPNCTYTYTGIYLGSEAKVYLSDKKMEFFFSFSVRDGVLVKIKCNQPYRVLFDYVDGSYYINDNSNIDYKRLIELLSAVRNDTCKRHWHETYDKLEKIMYDFICSQYKKFSDPKNFSNP